MGKGDGWKDRRMDMMEERARGKAGRVIPWAVGPWKPAVFRIREGRRSTTLAQLGGSPRPGWRGMGRCGWL